MVTDTKVATRDTAMLPVRAAMKASEASSRLPSVPPMSAKPWPIAQMTTASNARKVKPPTAPHRASTILPTRRR